MELPEELLLLHGDALLLHFELFDLLAIFTCDFMALGLPPLELCSLQLESIIYLEDLS